MSVVMQQRHLMKQCECCTAAEQDGNGGCVRLCVCAVCVCMCVCVCVHAYVCACVRTYPTLSGKQAWQRTARAILLHKAQSARATRLQRHKENQISSVPCSAVQRKWTDLPKCSVTGYLYPSMELFIFLNLSFSIEVVLCSVEVCSVVSLVVICPIFILYLKNIC
jgi:predicted metalloprotease